MRFFVLKSSAGSDAETLYEPIGDVHLGSAPVCPSCGGFAGALPWLAPYVVEIRHFGEHPGDVAFDLASGDLVVSNRFMSAWLGAGLRGIPEFHEVEVRGASRRSRVRAESFFHCVASYTAARVAVARSRIMRSSPATCDLCGGESCIEALRGFRIDESSWEGEDVFVPWGLSGVTVVSERVPDLARAHGLRNVTVTPVEEYSWGM